jgi:hypothetical protein
MHLTLMRTMTSLRLAAAFSSVSAIHEDCIAHFIRSDGLDKIVINSPVVCDIELSWYGELLLHDAG